MCNLNKISVIGRSVDVKFIMSRSFSSRLNLELGNKLKKLVSEQLHDEALRLYKQKIYPLGTYGFPAILPSVIKACSFNHDSFLLGQQLHCLFLKSGADRDTVVSNSLISMYTKFSSTYSARKLFDDMLQRDTVSYCSIVNFYCQDGLLYEALKVLKVMYFDGLVPKSELVASLLAHCTRIRSGNIKVARMLHALVLVDERMQKSILLSTELVYMYLKFDDTAAAFHVFDQMEIKNVVSWTAMICGCVANHQYEMSISLFLDMQRENLRPNRVTLLSILPVCVEFNCGLRLAKEIHGFSFRSGVQSDDRLRAALVTAYCRCGNLSLSRLVFDTSKAKDVVMWSSMISGYAEIGDCFKAMILFSQMRKEESEPNSVTLLAVVSACTHSASLNFASTIHSHILKCGFMSQILLVNAKIDMYAKCGCLLAARKVFYELKKNDLVSWTSMINACGLHGHGSEALEIFQEMIKGGQEVDGMAFLAVLSACNHAGLVEEAQSIFTQAWKTYHMPITLEHYACYINLLGRFGKIDKAFEVVRNMPMKPSPRIWSSLLYACEIHGRLDVAQKISAKELIKYEPDNPANHVLLRNIHTKSGNCHAAEEVRRIMQRRQLKKYCGFSKIEI